jgi:hypothetical protein
MSKDAIADAQALRMWAVEVHFACSSVPRVVSRWATKADAYREARAYASDAKGVWVVTPDGIRCSTLPSYWWEARGKGGML